MDLLRNAVIVITTLLLLAVKLFFINIEPEYSSAPIAWLDILLILGYVAIAFVLFTKESFKQSNFLTFRNNKYNLLFIVISILVVLFSFFINFSKVSIDWDALALYDARAIFLSNGLSFSDMRDLSEFDTKNAYYYLLYPPFSSILHHFWHQLFDMVPVSVLYSIFYTFIALYISTIYLKNLRPIYAFLGIFLVVANGEIFHTSIIEYTNIIYATFLVIGIFSLYQFIESKKLYYLLFSSIFVASSQFVRYLEPVWVAIFLAWIFSAIKTRTLKTDFKYIAIFIIPSLLQYYSWSYFTSVIAGNPDAIPLNVLALFDAGIGVFTGALLEMFKVVISSWGLLLVAYLISIVPIKSKESKSNLFLYGVIVLSIGLYLGGLYVISTSYSWWRELTDSLNRSSIFLIPVSVYLILKKLDRISISDKSRK